ncbi:MAG TPA: alpha/beta hydrolase [Gammaproteobacteria bacterium]|nr:alpha/beta hydrolase [Gammaproteobacteria bacterium]
MERRFVVPGLTLAGLEWGQPGDTPVIALHGWLDNAGSFDLLAPRLDAMHIVALDCAGHGHSGHRSPDAGYNIWQDVPDVFAVADALGWQRFALLGHSRGGAIAALAAATMPARVSALALLDGGVPIPGEPAEAPGRFAEALRARARPPALHGRVFPSREAAIRERSRGFTATTFDAAAILARRSLREAADGYSWFVDQRLKGESELRLSHEQIAAFMRTVEAPSLSILAAASPLTHRDWFQALLREIPGLKVIEVEGGHHFHLEGAEAEIADHVGGFLRGYT